MTAIATPPRVSIGNPDGGRFTAFPHAEPALNLAPAGPDFSPEFEAARGAELTKALQSLPKAPIREIIRASKTTDMLRDSYPENWIDGEAPQSRPDAVRSLEAAFPNLPATERDRHVELIRFAVHTEMKHWEDPGYVLNPDHPYELLIETADYDSDDDLTERGQDENRSGWATLADTAALHAITADQNYPALQAA
ncbi:MAG TPA: hypothetical protein VF867_19965 [Arthrobacter sp.]